MGDIFLRRHFSRVLMGACESWAAVIHYPNGSDLHPWVGTNVRFQTGASVGNWPPQTTPRGSFLCSSSGCWGGWVLNWQMMDDEWFGDLAIVTCKCKIQKHKNKKNIGHSRPCGFFLSIYCYLLNKSEPVESSESVQHWHHIKGCDKSTLD